MFKNKKYLSEAKLENLTPKTKKNSIMPIV